MWIESSFNLDGRQIGISVKRLDDAEAEQLAAVLAWFATTADASGDADDWPPTLQHIFKHYITLTMDAPIVEELKTSAFSTALCAAALRVFVDINNLEASIERHRYLQAPPDVDSDRPVH